MHFVTLLGASVGKRSSQERDILSQQGYHAASPNKVRIFSGNEV
ncbi:hypothetical protein KP78_20770 [Jeotgalibacillus soli]|uniref:Uncharacterized protein n=1 Tax=Jeotgalibacillus soli TaxID=889306 RepID=A0A0C2VNZ7_9BACL|nr:hypothetical protein KP78_20770 [Jeotgalibacillus soli]